MIESVEGGTAIETQKAGDLVMTKDNSAKLTSWRGHWSIGKDLLAKNPGFAPIRIKACAFGGNPPTTDPVVSPQYRIVIRSRIAHKLFDASEVLVATKQLVETEGIDICGDMDEVEYFHIPFDQHEIVFTDGAEAESLYTGQQTLKSVSPAARIEIFTLCPELAELDQNPVLPCTLASGRKVRRLAARHIQNSKSLVEQLTR